MELDRLLEELNREEGKTLSIEGLPVFFEITNEELSTLSLATTLYKGEEGYIPPSVRRCAASGRAIPSRLPYTRLIINEADATILLECSVTLELIRPEDFSEEVREFIWLAREWKLLLDEHGERDLLPIYIKK